MDKNLSLTHERVDDIPMLFGLMVQLGLPACLLQAGVAGALPGQPRAAPRAEQRLAGDHPCLQQAGG